MVSAEAVEEGAGGGEERSFFFTTLHGTLRERFQCSWGVDFGLQRDLGVGVQVGEGAEGRRLREGRN